MPVGEEGRQGEGADLKAGHRLDHARTVEHRDTSVGHRDYGDRHNNP